MKLFAAQRRCGFGFFDGEALLLETGAVIEDDTPASDWIFNLANRGFGNGGGDAEVQGQTVNGFWWRVKEKVRDIECAPFVLENGRLGSKGELPISMTFPKGIGRQRLRLRGKDDGV